MERTPLVEPLPLLLLRNEAVPRTPVIDGVVAKRFVDIDADTSDAEAAASVKLAGAIPEYDTAWMQTHQRALVESCAYFCAEKIRGPREAPYYGQFLLGPHHMEWDKLVATEKRLCILAARDSGKSYFFTVGHSIWRAGYNMPRSEGIIFSATQPQSEDFLRKIKDELLENPRLEHLVPYSRDRYWSARKIKLRNGSTIRAAGFGVKVRGAHPDWIVGDDMLNDNDIYSETIRQRNIDYFFSAIAGMVHRTKRLFVVGCVVPETWVVTEQGLRQIGDLAPGNTPQTAYPWKGGAVLGKEGMKVPSHYWVNGECATKKVELACSFSLEGSHRHPVWVMREDGIPEWVRLDDLAVGDMVAVRVGANQWGHPIDLRPFKTREGVRSWGRREIDIPERLSPDLAYLLGLWTAEGSFESSGRVMISNTEPEIQQWLHTRPFGMEFKSNESCPWTMRASAKEFLDLIEWLGGHLGKCNTKIIPSRVMTADMETVREFLRGLYDGDGCASVSGHVQHITLATTSQQMAIQVQQLLLNFGIVTSTYRSKPSPTERAPHPNHDLFSVKAVGGDAVLFLREIGFRLHRKQSVIADMQEREPYRTIPHQGSLIAKMRKEKPRRPRGEVATIPPANVTSAAQAKESEATTLARILAWFEQHGAVGPATAQLRENLACPFKWLPVESIEDGRAETVDFVIPDGASFVTNGVVSHNTPLHQGDLYAKLREPNSQYVCKTYPAEDAKGNPMWPERYSRADLDAKKKELGSPARYAREFLCQPLSDEASLFPSKLFDGSDVRLPYKLGMPGSYWDKRGAERFTGVDIAMSSEVGADYFVAFTIAVEKDGTRWVANIRRGKGWSFSRQLNEIKEEFYLLQSTVIHIEANQAQRIWTDELARTTNLPVRRFFTTGIGGAQPKKSWRKGATQVSANKNHLEKGVPSLRMSLEHRKWRIPRGNEDSIEKTDVWIGEMGALGWINGKMQSVGSHDDTCYAMWMADLAARMSMRELEWMDNTPARAATQFTAAPIPVQPDKDVDGPSLQAEQRALAAIQQGQQVDVGRDAYLSRVRGAIQDYAAKAVDYGDNVRAQVALLEVQRLDKLHGFRSYEQDVASQNGAAYSESWAPTEGAPGVDDLT